MAAAEQGPAGPVAVPYYELYEHAPLMGMHLHNADDLFNHSQCKRAVEWSHRVEPLISTACDGRELHKLSRNNGTLHWICSNPSLVATQQAENMVSAVSSLLLLRASLVSYSWRGCYAVHK